MRNTFVVLLLVVVVGCTSKDTTRDERKGSLKTADAIFQHLEAVAQQDTLRRKEVASYPLEVDSTEAYAGTIQSLLEFARQHYLAALEAQESADTLLSEREFEQAIEILNRLSYYPSIETNTDFTDLSRNIIEDYEKYIAVIDDLAPEASIFALREKLAQVVESADPSKISIPTYEITGTTVPLPYNEHVGRNIAFFVGKGRVHFERWMHLSGKFFPMMKRIFAEEGVPEELVFLSMVESGLRPDARSWAKAVGLWQFVKGTGNLYGLRGNWWYDERRDFEKSTRAAARHLKDLYAEFGDWHVSLAAYNSGAGRVFRATRRSGSTDYWQMRQHLPRETRNYVPQFIAVARMAMDPARYGFQGITRADSLQYDVVTIDDCIELQILAECAETDVATLRELNPEILQWCTPPGVTGYRLRIPPGRSDTFAAKLAQVPREELRDWLVHTVRRGETLSGIAAKYGLNSSILQEVNNIRNVRALSIGANLTIPLPAGALTKGRKTEFEYDRAHKPVTFGKARTTAEREAVRPVPKAPSRVAKAPRGKQKLVYLVKRGDTIGHIAQWYGVRASDIRNWNNIAYGSHIYVGQEIAVYVPAERADQLKSVSALSFTEKQDLGPGDPGPQATRVAANVSNGFSQYVVRPGDTLDEIARSEGVSVEDLKAWNGLRGSTIYPGQTLDIFSRPDVRTKIINPSRPAVVTGQVERSSAAEQAQTHRVRMGETLTQIAGRYGTTVNAIMRLNELSSPNLSIGQILRIPSQNLPKSEVFYYRVKPGDSLWKLSRDFGVPMNQIEALNDLSHGLRVGDQIAIPKPQ